MLLKELFGCRDDSAFNTSLRHLLSKGDRMSIFCFEFTPGNSGQRYSSLRKSFPVRRWSSSYEQGDVWSPGVEGKRAHLLVFAMTGPQLGSPEH